MIGAERHTALIKIR